MSPIPTIFLVDAGEVLVSDGTKRVTLGRNEIALFPENRAYTLEKAPGQDGLFQARVLACPRVVFEETYSLFDIPLDRSDGMTGAMGFTSKGMRELLEAVSNALMTNRQLPQIALKLMVQQLVAWLGDAGVCLPLARPMKTSDLVRNLVRSDLQFEWKASDVAGQLNTSEATLRRRLSAEGYSFLSILSDERMLAALGQLQSGGEKISSIAYSVGYDSPSRFAGKFRKRFGVLPSEVRDGRLLQ